MNIKERRTLKQKFKIYWPFSLCAIQQAVSYKGRFYLFIVARILSVFVTYYLWIAIYQSSNNVSLSGFTMKEMVLYIFISFITINIVNVSISYEIGSDVVEGSIATNLIKPINYKVRLFFGAIGNLIYRFFMPSLLVWIALIVYQYVKYQALPPRVDTIVFYLISMLLSFLILFFFDFCFGMLAFYTTYIWGMNMAKVALLSFLSGQIIPLAFFPETIQKVFDYLPFASMNYVPVMIYLGKISKVNLGYALGRQLIWVGLLWLLSHVLWNKVTKRLTVLGG